MKLYFIIRAPRKEMKRKMLVFLILNIPLQISPNIDHFTK